MSKKHKTPLVIVHWVDSRQPNAAWVFLADLPKPSPVVCCSVGWLLKRGKTITLCPNLGDVEAGQVQGSGCIEIPRECITAIYPVAESSKKKISI